VPIEVRSKRTNAASEGMPFGIAKGKSQIAKFEILDLQFEIASASED
jgi:hypothetical protein